MLSVERGDDLAGIEVFKLYRLDLDITELLFHARRDPQKPVACRARHLRLAEAGHRIVAFRADQSPWRDVGSPEESLAEAREGV